MSVTVSVNFLSVIHCKSGGVSPSFPDVCKTPMPGGPVPLPYPNIARSADAADTAKKVSADGHPLCISSSSFSTSTGDEAGSLGGVISGKTKGKAEFVNYAFDVKAEGEHVPRAFDLVLHNDKNTPPFPVLQGPAVAFGGESSRECVCCGEPL